MKKYRLMTVFADNNVYDDMIKMAHIEGDYEFLDDIIPCTYMGIYKGYITKEESTNLLEIKIAAFIVNFMNFMLYVRTGIYNKSYIINEEVEG